MPRSFADENEMALAEGSEGGRSRNSVRFYRKPVRNEAKTIDAGRPIFEPVTFIEISVPGDRTNIIDRPVREFEDEDDKRTYAPQYQAFLADKSQDEASGTLLSAWGGIPPERVEEYAYFKVRTVEHLAEVADGNIGNMGPLARGDQKKAVAFLKASKGRAPVMKLQAEMEALVNENAMLKKALEEQGARMTALEKRK